MANLGGLGENAVRKPLKTQGPSTPLRSGRNDRIISRIRGRHSNESRKRTSEKELCAQLNQARWIGADDLAEGRTADIAVDGLRSEELRVIENVESLQPKLEGLRFGQAHRLEQGHVVIVQAWSVKESPGRGAW